MSWISLNEMRFRAPVGVYEEEKINLNELTIDLSVKVNTTQANSSDELAHTVDYQNLYDLSKCVVMAGGNLLEATAQKIGTLVLENHPPVSVVKIKVSKNNPPIAGDAKSASVYMKFKR